MIYSSINESKILKADWMIKNPIGAQAASRREPKLMDMCRCNDELAFHGECQCNGVHCLNRQYPHQICKSFFPAKYAIGKIKSIQRKRTEHGIRICKHGYESPLTNPTSCPENHYCIFKPALYKILSGEWHKSWADKAGADMKIWQKEAELEGFKSVLSWKDWYPRNGIDIDKTWRISMKRIQ